MNEIFVSEPSYIKLYKNGELENRKEKLLSLLKECKLCPRNCGVNRLNNEIGFCGVGRKLMISSYGPHFGEESPLVGINGSGTIFITGCNLKCVFCQNYEISHLMEGKEITSEEFAKIMLYLQDIGCHNINIVTPTHIVPQFIEALIIAIDKGLCLPIVYNTGGYDNIETIKLLEGIIDIYMPDFKFYDNKVAYEFTKVSDYREKAKESIAEMYKQVGDLIIENGIAKKGLLVRHLVLPNGLAGTREVAEFISTLSKNTYINIMAQYRPCGEVSNNKYKKINRRITYEEFANAKKDAKEAGLYRFDK